jgi:hypothetical protein
MVVVHDIEGDMNSGETETSLHIWTFQVTVN